MANTTSLAILDRDHLNLMTGQDSELAAEIIEIFTEQARMWGRLLTTSEADTAWTDAAHTLKGAALGVGAMVLAKACEKAETLGRSGTASRTEAAVALDDVRQALTQALEEAARVAHDLAVSSAIKESKDSNS